MSKFSLDLAWVCCIQMRLARPMVNEDAWPALFRRTLGLSPVLCLRELKLASSGAACEGTLPPLGSQ